MCMTFEEMAEDLAMNAKAGRFDDLGCLYDEDDHGHLTKIEWLALCDRAEELIPNVTPPDDMYIAWARAERECRLETQAEMFTPFGCER